MEFAGNIEETLKKLISYINENEDKNTPVINYKSASELSDLVDFKLSSSNQDLNKLIDDYLKYSVRTSHPQFNNQLWAGINPISVIGEIVTAFTNTTMATYEMAPMATLMEHELVAKMNSLIGFHDGDGIMLTGGSNANMQAIHVARQLKFPEVKTVGNNSRALCLFVSEESHYSFEKAVNLMGIGTNNLIKIKTKNGKMDPAHLEQEILKAQHGDKTPFFVGSTAGTTVKGVFDPIIPIDKICKKYDLWHHIDGAWGGSVLLSQTHRKLLTGCELADSFTWDAHKMMGSTLITSFFLTKHKNALIEANSGGGNSYIFHEYENTQYDTGPKSLQCGRRNDAFKLWLTWKMMGDAGFETLIDKLFENAQYATEIVKTNPRLKLLFEPESLNVCYQVIPLDEKIDICKYNYDLRFKIAHCGSFMVNFSTDDGLKFFRHTFANNQTAKEDITNYFNDLLKQ